MSALCRRYGIGRTIAYKLLRRLKENGDAGFADLSRRPLHSPRRSAGPIEGAVLKVRAEHPAWGGRKISKALQKKGLGETEPSTVTDIGPQRHGARAVRRRRPGVSPASSAAPNELWQMDFKGHVLIAEAGRLHPLTVLDDHSRFALVLAACGRRTGNGQNPACRGFPPLRPAHPMVTDNGPPWGDRGNQPFTRFGVFLIEQGIRISHSRPYHPQTLGKDERFHRSLKAEAMQRMFADLAASQAALDTWRNVYNDERPHEAIGLAVPAERYSPSSRHWRDTPEPWFYSERDEVRRVQKKGEASLFGQTVKISKAFHGKDIAFRPAQDQRDGVYDAYFRHQKIKTIDLTASKE